MLCFFNKKISGYVFCFFILIYSGLVFPSSTLKECGGVFFEVDIKAGELSDNYKVFFIIKNERKLIYDDSPSVGVGISCVKDKSNNELILFQVSDAGSGRIDIGGYYGVFDPSLKEFI